MKPRKIRRYGWKRDLPSRIYTPFRLQLTSLPSSFSLLPSGFLPPVFDQGNEGSCVGNSGTAVMQYIRAKRAETDITLSRNFLYYNARVLSGDADYDGGCQISDAISTLKTTGVCSEPTWPYNESNVLLRPSDDAYSEAVSYEALTTEQVAPDITAIKTAIASGIPVWFGFTVYDAFESPAVAQTGVLNMPGPTEDIVGGHAVLAVAYDDTAERVTVRNSWGSSWGQKGYFTMPYEYVASSDLADDRWAVYTVK